MINDAHCHFFSNAFFTALARQRGKGETADDLCRELQWDAPEPPDALGDRWVRELDAHHVARTALIASMPGDEASVSAAVRRHPARFVGFFMLDPSTPDAVDRTRAAVTTHGLRAICLFPAMHHVPLHDDRVTAILDVAAAQQGVVVFVHCGVLSVGVRRRLGLPSRFDLRLGNPLEVARLALAYPNVPFIIPHFGAGLLREALMAADMCPNIHLDTSSSNGWVRYTPGLSLESVFAAALSVAGPSRLLFGTDSSFFPRGWQRSIHDQQRAIVKALNLDAEGEAQIFGLNFDRLFPA